MQDKIKSYICLMNTLGKESIPFIFIIDFEIRNIVCLPLKYISPDEILFDFNGFKNHSFQPDNGKNIILKKKPVEYERYLKAFNKVQKYFKEGYSYILNLTFPTEIQITVDIKDIFIQSKAKYKLYFKNQFITFSPETFIKINDNKIFSYPMKGTIKADIPEAERILRNNEKERAEHATIVDLIRNDIGQVAKDVKVENFCYAEKIKTNEGELLQTSSEITGKLPRNYNENIGEIIFKLLPAGSVTGAPKKKTVEIIKEVEEYERGYYTGIFGYFDGKNLDSSVMIRFIENINGKYYYKSGGGIMIYSDPLAEYKELLDKVYVPFV
jgi:para-aminobenzoate synthetase component 1